MVEDPETIKEPLDGELSRKVVGAIKHHIGMVDVPPHRIHHVAETMSKISYGAKRRAAQRDRKP